MLIFLKFQNVTAISTLQQATIVLHFVSNILRYNQQIIMMYGNLYDIVKFEIYMNNCLTLCENFYKITS